MGRAIVCVIIFISNSYKEFHDQQFVTMASWRILLKEQKKAKKNVEKFCLIWFMIKLFLTINVDPDVMQLHTYFIFIVKCCSINDTYYIEHFYIIIIRTENFNYANKFEVLFIIYFPFHLSLYKSSIICFRYIKEKYYYIGIQNSTSCGNFWTKVVKFFSFYFIHILSKTIIIKRLKSFYNLKYIHFYLS